MCEFFSFVIHFEKDIPMYIDKSYKVFWYKS